MWIRMFCPGTEMQHVFPVPDADGHRIAEDGKCPCGAWIREDAPGVVLHRSRDAREVIEDAEAILRRSDD